MKKYLPLFWLLTLSLGACIDETDIPLSGESILVVDGWITDEAKAHKVRLSYSHSFNQNPTFAPIHPLAQGARVEILDDQGGTVLLEEDKNGVYYTPIGFAGTIGHSYSLRVTLNDGSVYYSLEERLLPPGATIDEVCFENTIRDMSAGETLSQEQEVTFNVNFTDLSETQSYYRWNYYGVYEIEAPMADTSPPCDETTPPSFKCGPCEVPTKTCWATERDFEFLKVTDDLTFNGKSVEDYPVYATAADRKFELGYAGHVVLQSLTERAYTYWHAISTQLQNNGTIFETPNYQIRGNIYSENKPDEFVLGYFGASSISSGRVIVTNSDVPGSQGPIDCTPNDSGCVPASCIDCRKWPASSTKPDYWPW